MGYLPIILSMLGVVFLWGLVNYSTIKSKKEALNLAAERVFTCAALRHRIAEQLAKEHLYTDGLSQIASQPPTTAEETTIQEKLQAEKQITQQIAALPQLSEEEYQELLVADRQYRRAVTLYHTYTQQYRELLTKNPSKLVARLTGYR